MAVSVGDEITAAQYNGLQSRVATILGTGSGSDGYGQALASSQVTANVSVVQASDFDNLRTDINKANNHQSGTNALIGDIQPLQTIGADRSETARGSGVYHNDEGFNDYDTAIGVIETNKFLIDGGESSVEAKTTSTRTTNWNGTITHTFTVTFTNANQRRHFFNSGGEIRFSASQSGGSGSKTLDWRALLSAMGTIKFGYTATTATGSGTTTNIGNYDLTGTYQTIFTKTGSGNYAENDYNIAARVDAAGSASTAAVLRFRVEFRDDDTGDQITGGVGTGGIDGSFTPLGPAVDEDVNGTVVSTIQQLRATGSNVSVASPAYSNVTNL